MTAIFDSYVPGTSLLHRMDARVKLWAALLGLIGVFMLPNLWARGFFLIGIHLVLLTSGVPWRVLSRLWRQMAVLIVLIMLLQPFLQPTGHQLLAFGPLRLTVGGVLEALDLIVRAMGIAFIIGAVLFTTAQTALLRALVRLGMPYTGALTISLALRFLPAIQDLFRAVRDAQAARGWIAKGNLVQRFRDYLPVLVAVLIGTLRMSDQLTLALAARGLETMERRTTWHELRMRTSDWIFAAAFTVGMGALAWWRLGS